MQLVAGNMARKRPLFAPAWGTFVVVAGCSSKYYKAHFGVRGFLDVKQNNVCTAIYGKGNGVIWKRPLTLDFY